MDEEKNAAGESKRQLADDIVGGFSGYVAGVAAALGTAVAGLAGGGFLSAFAVGALCGLVVQMAMDAYKSLTRKELSGIRGL